MLSRANNSRSKLKRVAAPDFDLATTLDSGQVFHWRAEGRGFVGLIGDEPVYVEQHGDTLRFEGASKELLTHYFALDHPLREICGSFPNDPAMNDARSFCGGLRILRQPKWECLATFICSSMKQVAHIRQMSAALRLRFSSAINFGRPRPTHSRRHGRLRSRQRKNCARAGSGIVRPTCWPRPA